MPGICRESVDSAGGALISAKQDFVFANGRRVIVHGDPVTPHGDKPHNSPTMIAGCDNVYINGIMVCNRGDLATCGHSATGSSNVFIGD